ncbi:GNAT family N-acetyltransferase [Yoonia vestfoldensis]|uniref:GNAT family N-acetyltransferase n=1 Tax=Yoonia vestfoldensis TaxID=245188 RepID=UPI00035E5A7D|nr:GNAT family N-acetyltransferase [Yoonia vestfoldensis]
MLPLKTDFGLIREAQPSDADCLLHLIGQLAAHHADTQTLSRDDLLRDAFSEAPWIHVMVAETDGRLVGYAALCGLIQLQFGARGMDMHHLFTEAAFCGRGVGRGLIQASRIKAVSLSCRYLAVGTHPDNLDAQGFYVAAGFVRKDAFPPRFSMLLDA